MYVQINNELFFENIYVPSDIIDSVWRSLILSTKIYNEFWLELWGGFIDRIEPRFSDERVTKKRRFEDFLIQNRSILQPYFMLWISIDTFVNDIDCRRFNVTLKRSEIDAIVSKIYSNSLKLSSVVKADEIIRYSEEAYDFILNLHENLFDTSLLVQNKIKANYFVF